MSGQIRRASFRREQSGQTLVIVALMIVALLGFTGLVTDIAWYEVNLMRVQRAADAAALAGVVYLPGNAAGAQTAAQQEASKNGYADGLNGATVTATPEALNNRIPGVTGVPPVRWCFPRLFGINQFSATRNARAEFVLPVPMGSPENYYGISRLCSNTACTTVGDAVTPANPLSSQGFWGAVITKGGDRGNGDLYSTYYNGNPTQNVQYDANGY